MSLTPDPSLAAPDPPPLQPGVAVSQPALRHSSSLLAPLFLALAAFAVGLFLMIFPWTEDWGINWLQQISPRIQDVWNQDSFRGAFTGLGLVNIYIACLQIARLFRHR